MKFTLMVSVILAYGINPVFSVEIEHHHSTEDDHHHCWLDWLFDCHGHPCGGDDDPGDAPGPSQPSQEGDDCSHSHLIFPGSIGHATNWTPTPFPMPPAAALVPRAEHGQLCPDGPSFGLLKPPQLY